MQTFVKVAQLVDLKPGRGKVVSVGYGDLALFQVGNEVFAIDDGCARCGASLAAGTLQNACVICARCGWRYDLKSGSLVSLPELRLGTYEAKIAGSWVMLANRFRKSRPRE
jgi:nitrite reductase/ring-hydroxylating ferredoxin subunit